MKTVGLFFGGPSNEHEISIESAKNIFNNFPNKKYKIKLIFWNKDGKFYLKQNFSNKKGEKIDIEDFKNIFDIAFPITHGKFGEDGILQSILESQKIKYCGCHVLSSALCMDKALFKKLLASENIEQVKFTSIDYLLDSQIEINSKISEFIKKFKLPIYIKPANSGSSVGITKIEKISQIKKAIKIARKHDNKIIIEEGLIRPKEIEIAVLGNKKIIVSPPGELKLVKDFYDYNDKYRLNQSSFIIPAHISRNQEKNIISLAEKIYKLCSCSGFARIDFFISKDKIFVNEINTLPGFTNISMYPALMEKTGIKYIKLIEKIINLAY